MYKKGGHKMNFLLEMKLTQDAVDTISDTLLDWCLNTGIKIIISLLIFAISFRVINVIVYRIG